MYITRPLNLSDHDRQFNRLEHNYSMAKMNLTLANRIETFISHVTKVSSVRVAVRLKKDIVKQRNALNALDGRFDMECTIKGIRQLKSDLNANTYKLNVLLYSNLIDLENKCNNALIRLDEIDKKLIEIDKECDEFLSKGFNSLIAYFLY